MPSEYYRYNWIFIFLVREIFDAIKMAMWVGMSSARSRNFQRGFQVMVSLNSSGKSRNSHMTFPFLKAKIKKGLKARTNIDL